MKVVEMNFSKGFIKFMEEEIQMGLNIMKACVDTKDEDMAVEIIMTWLKPFMKENIEDGLSLLKQLAS